MFDFLTYGSLYRPVKNSNNTKVSDTLLYSNLGIFIQPLDDQYNLAGAGFEKKSKGYVDISQDIKEGDKFVVSNVNAKDTVYRVATISNFNFGSLQHKEIFLDKET